MLFWWIIFIFIYADSLFSFLFALLLIYFLRFFFIKKLMTWRPPHWNITRTSGKKAACWWRESRRWCESKWILCIVPNDEKKSLLGCVATTFLWLYIWLVWVWQGIVVFSNRKPKNSLVKLLRSCRPCPRPIHRRIESKGHHQGFVSWKSRFWFVHRFYCWFKNICIYGNIKSYIHRNFVIYSLFHRQINVGYIYCHCWKSYRNPCSCEIQNRPQRSPETAANYEYCTGIFSELSYSHMVLWKNLL